jgi:kynurenine formamidase
MRQVGVSRRTVALLVVGVAALAFALGSVLAVGAAHPRAAAPPGFAGAVLLSHVNNPAKTPGFPGDPVFRLQTSFTVHHDGYYLQYVHEGEHTGTHYSAPCHFHVNEICAPKLKAEDLVLPAVVLDVRDRVADDADYAITVADLVAWEDEHGPMPSEAAVLALTGCDAFWGPSAAKDEPTYYNCGTKGAFHQPGFSLEAVEWLIDRDVLGVRGALGTDTFGPDPGTDPDFLETALTLDEHRLTLENLTNLDQLPAAGAWIVIGGPRNAKGSGGPGSIIALVP